MEVNWRMALINSLLILCTTLVFFIGPLLYTSDHFPVHRGFSCSDESIRYPFHRNTISVPLCGVIAISIITSMILLGECLNFSRKDPNERDLGRLLRSLAVQNGYWLLGLELTLILTQMAKYTVGRLRPHFLAVCNITNLDELCKNPLSFIEPTQYVCTGDKDQVREARISFFSGHSITITYCCVYSVLFLQARIGSHQSSWRGGLCILQSILIGIALVICASRITDYWHHSTDVLAGATFGVLSASWTAIVWAGIFHRNKTVFVEVYKTEKDLV